MSTQLLSGAPFGDRVSTSQGHGHIINRNGVGATLQSQRRTSAKTDWVIPPSDWVPKIHPRDGEVARELDDYFLEHWPFPDDAARDAFLKAGYSKHTCLSFPLAKDDRIHFACRLLSILFMVDDILEDMSFEEGDALNRRLIELSKGHTIPDRNKPAEYIIYDLWISMRAFDNELTEDIIKTTFTLMDAQTDKKRLMSEGLGQYLRHREKDVGKALLSALMRFTMDIRPSPDELSMVRPFEENCSKHISIVNDIYSWEKEVVAAEKSDKEGSQMFSAVKVVTDETSLGVASTKRVLWSMVREWELKHDEMLDDLVRSTPGGPSEEVLTYIRGLQYQMSGNEHWSKTTGRYNA